MVDCTFSAEYGNIGCKGGKVSSTLLYMLDDGAMPNATYPYTARDTDGCLYDSGKVQQRYRTFQRLPVVTEDYIKDYVAANGPVIIGMNGSSKKFQFYKSGVFFDPDCKTTVNHAVVRNFFELLAIYFHSLFLA